MAQLLGAAISPSKCWFLLSVQELNFDAIVYIGIQEVAMNKLKDNINLFKDRVAHLLHPHEQLDGSVAGEQTEEVEDIDTFMNPLLGVYVVRHPVGRRPRRA